MDDPQENLSGLDAAIVRIAALHVDYPSPLLDGAPVPALRGIDLALAPGSFIAVMGPVGAGKSTLCLALNGAIPHAIDGDLAGTVEVCGMDTRAASMGRLSAQVGLLLEDVEAQLFSASVADEVAFGLEGLGLPPPEIEARLRWALDWVGLSGLEQRVPRTLSGGQQKRLALASLLAMQPRLLVLDEPTAGLDPRGRHEVLAAIDRMRQDSSGMTVLMATQDAEAVARFAGRVLVLHEGRIALDGSPQQLFTDPDSLARLDAWGIDVPQLARLGQRTGQNLFTAAGLDPRAAGQVLLKSGFFSAPVIACPLGRAGSVSDKALPDAAQNGPGDRVVADAPRDDGIAPIVQVRGLGHRYPGTDAPALTGVDLELYPGEWLAIVGVNGSGKSTLIRHLNGLLKPSEGRVTVDGQDTRGAQIGELARVVSYLPQNPGLLLFASTVRREVAYGPRQLGLRGDALEARVTETLERVGLVGYAGYPPAVLSYGLRRQVALASVLAMQAPVLALDEPASGLDRGAAGRLLAVIAGRQRRGTAVIMITHDLRWAARYAGRVALLHGGRLVACGPTRAILSDVDLLAGAGLDPLPVTALARQIGLPPPLPLTVDELLTRSEGGGRV